MSLSVMSPALSVPPSNPLTFETRALPGQVETTGMADPTFIQVIFQDDFLSEQIRVDAFVTVVDAANFSYHVEDARAERTGQYWVGRNVGRSVVVCRVVVSRTIGRLLSDRWPV